MRISWLAIALLLIPAAGCSTDESRPTEEVDVDWRSGGKGDGQSCDDALPATDYYRYFAYSDLGDDWYRMGFTFDRRAVLTNGDEASMTVYFLEMDRVIIEYREEHRIRAGESEVLNSTIVVTRAQIDSTTRAITLVGVGTGTPVKVTGDGGCSPGIDFTYSDDLRSPGLAGKLTEIVMGRTSARVIDPDHLDNLNETARRWFEEDVARGKITIIRK